MLIKMGLQFPLHKVVRKRPGRSPNQEIITNCASRSGNEAAGRGPQGSEPPCGLRKECPRQREPGLGSLEAGICPWGWGVGGRREERPARV